MSLSTWALQMMTMIYVRSSSVLVLVGGFLFLSFFSLFPQDLTSYPTRRARTAAHRCLASRQKFPRIRQTTYLYS
ncbi:hypothetical protein F5X98DRAFT_341628 [Xylaria grammica]|nr:hypothetical protein F5X98DRAFT_341628 [Xylaria grammica]